jgi:hypothetical protein
MIDTVKYRFHATITRTPPPAWHVNSSAFWFNLCHSQHGIRISQQSRSNDSFVEVSLPRLLFGSNARLITRQHQIDAALKLADQLTAQVAAPRHAAKEFTRVDFAWQVLGNIEDYIFALYGFPYPQIRKGPTIYHRETIEWRSKDLSIVIYDKKRERNKSRGKNGRIVRIEVQLKGKKLQQAFAQPFLTRLDFARCYRVFRKFVLQLEPIAVPCVSKRSDVYQQAIAANWKLKNGLPYFEVMVREHKTSYQTKLRRKLSGDRLRAKQIDLRKQFPPKKPNRVFRRDGFDFGIPPSRFLKFLEAYNKIQKRKRATAKRFRFRA